MAAPSRSLGEMVYSERRIPVVAGRLAPAPQAPAPGPREREPDQQQEGPPVATATLPADLAAWPTLICMLGDFRLLRAGQRVALRSGGKVEALLCHLALHYGSTIPRAGLVNALWPSSDAALAAQSLNSLIYQLHKLVGDGPAGTPLVVHDDGQYRLNEEAGVSVDVACFESLANAGEQHARSGDRLAAVAAYARAVDIYRGDLCIATDVKAILVRERLRSRCLTLLAQIADHYHAAGDYTACLSVAWRLLDEDPCREDAHRLVMRCYVKRGERAAALHHYHTCEAILRAEIDAEPEPATKALLEQIRLHPELI